MVEVPHVEGCNNTLLLASALLMIQRLSVNDLSCSDK